MKKLEVGKSYKLILPKSGKKIKVHIDYILESKVYKDTTLVIYRYWNKYWRQDITTIDELKIYNYEKTI